jgi:hypothetical protein
MDSFLMQHGCHEAWWMMIMMIMMAPNSEANILQLSSSSSYALSLSLEEEPPYNNPVLD